MEKGQVTATDVTGNDILNSYNYGIVILTEPILVTVPGNIVYAADNVENRQERKLQEFFRNGGCRRDRRAGDHGRRRDLSFPSQTAARRKKLKEVQPHWLTFYMNKGD